MGNQVMAAVGGRAVHPVNVRVGGFYSVPARAVIKALAGGLHEALDASLETVKWVSGFDFPDVDGDYTFVALQADGRYPLETGRVTSSSGLDCTATEFAEVAVEEHVARSTALHARLNGHVGYLTGPLARYALNSTSLTPLAKAAGAEAGLGPVCRNPFRSIVVRAVETVFACEEALRLVEEYEPPELPAVVMPAVAEILSADAGGFIAGAGATEAPRGLLLHRYEIDTNGLVHKARIMPPTSQNQLSIEDDLRRVAESGFDLPHDELRLRAEMAVRNHDPCISCATHFLDVTVERRP
jgi:coenzyme F420-reducing hydrogenase alpha subunit